MTTHETDRPAEYESVEETDELGGRDVLTDEQDVPAADTDLEVAEPELQEPGDDEPDTAWSREAHAVDEDAAEEPISEPDPRERLAPVGRDSAVDPGTGSYEDRWGAIQAGFIDDPGRTVESASALMAEIGDEIARSISDEREGIDNRWRTTESSTDDLRVAMQDYRTLYGRLTQFTSRA